MPQFLRLYGALESAGRAGETVDEMSKTQRMAQESALTVWTIGHSTRTIDDFIALLRANGIEALADVRRFPGSRKYPQFNVEPLRASLTAAGIAYVPMTELGGRRRPRPDSRNTVWRNESFRGYADFMETDAFRAGIEKLLTLAREKRTAVMCSEAVWWRCHRSMISDQLKASGIRVLHIMEGGKCEEHPYTAAARLVDGQLSYAPGVGVEGRAEWRKNSASATT